MGFVFTRKLCTCLKSECINSSLGFASELFVDSSHMSEDCGLRIAAETISTL